MKKRKKLTAAQRRKHGLPLYLRLSPQNITQDAWYYEEPKGLHLVSHDAPIPGHSHQVTNLVIKWRSLEETMKRYRAYRRACRASEVQP